MYHQLEGYGRSSLEPGNRDHHSDDSECNQGHEQDWAEVIPAGARGWRIGTEELRCGIRHRRRRKENPKRRAGEVSLRAPARRHPCTAASAASERHGRGSPLNAAVRSLRATVRHRLDAVQGSLEEAGLASALVVGILLLQQAETGGPVASRGAPREQSAQKSPGCSTGRGEAAEWPSQPDRSTSMCPALRWEQRQPTRTPIPRAERPSEGQDGSAPRSRALCASVQREYAIDRRGSLDCAVFTSQAPQAQVEGSHPARRGRGWAGGL